MSVIPFSGTVGTYTNAVGQLTDGEFDLGDITAPAGAALDVLGWVADPFGALAGAALGPLLDYLANNFPPLKWPLDRLAGDQAAIMAKAQSWQDVSDSLVAVGNAYAATGSDLPTWDQGTAPAGYRATQEMVLGAFQGAANQAASLAGGITTVGQVCAGVRNFIWGIVKGFVSSAVGNAIAAAASALVTLGGSIGAFCTWFSARFAVVTGKIGRKLADLMDYMAKVTGKWGKLSEAFKRAAEALRKYSRSQFGRAGGLTASANRQAGSKVDPTHFDRSDWQQNLGDGRRWPNRANSAANAGDKAGDGQQDGVGTSGTVDGLA